MYFGTVGGKGVRMWKYKPQSTETTKYPPPLEIIKATVTDSNNLLLDIQKEVTHKHRRLDRTQAGVQLKQETKDALTKAINRHREQRKKLKDKYRNSDRSKRNSNGPSLTSEMSKLEASQKREVMEHTDRLAALKYRVIGSSNPFSRLFSMLGQSPPN